MCSFAKAREEEGEGEKLQGREEKEQEKVERLRGRKGRWGRRGGGGVCEADFSDFESVGKDRKSLLKVLS